MGTQNPQFVVAPSLEMLFIDEDTGAPLSQGLVYFYSDINRTVLKNIYTQVDTPTPYSYVPLPNPVVLSMFGTFEDASGNNVIPYYFPFDANGNQELYYIEVYSSLDGITPAILQFTREGWPPNAPEGVATTGEVPFENQITNPQFSLLNFVSPLTITTSGTHNIAPGWDLVLEGTGSTTITQEIFSGNQNIVNNPPYSLQFANTGWTSAILQQTFTQNGALWANAAVSASVTAKAVTTSQSITLQYMPSTPAVPIVIVTTSLPTSAYVVSDGAISLGASTNTDLSTVAFVDFQIVLPASGTVALTNIQIFGQTTPTIVEFQQETHERQVDHSFNVYSQSLIMLPKNTILTAWNFAQNPYQFVTPAITNQAAIAQDVADQTIFIQQTAGAYNVGQAPIANNEVLTIVNNGSTSTNNQFAIIQYIGSKSIRPYWSYILSSLVRARIFSSSAVTMKMRLIWRTTSPSTIGNTEPIASWTSGQDPVFSAGWTAISALNDPAYPLQNSYEGINNAVPSFSFNQFQMPPASTDLQMLGIVLYTVGNTTTADRIIIDRVSLLPNKFACDSSTETFDEVLRKCQYYYEKSYDVSVLPGTPTTFAGVSSTAFVGLFGSQIPDLTTPFKVYKRSDPSIMWFSPQSGNTARIYDVTTAGDLTVIGNGSPGQGNTSYPTISGSPSNSIVSAHWTADSRLGV